MRHAQSENVSVILAIIKYLMLTTSSPLFS